MKNFIIIAIVFVVAIVANAQTPYTGDQKPSGVAVSTKVITPFSVHDYVADAFSNRHLGDVIKGNVKVFTPFQIVRVFEFHKEANYEVYMSTQFFDKTADDGKTKIDAGWNWHDVEPVDLPPQTEFINTNNLQGYWRNPVSPTKAWSSIVVKSIDARLTTSTGIKTWTANVTGAYTSL